MLEKNEETLKLHDERIKTLEESDKERDRQIKELRTNYKNLESTIIQENRETRMIFQTTMNKQWDLIKSAQDLNNERTMKEYEVRRADMQAEAEIKKTRMQTYADITLKLVGSGGLIYIVATSFFNVQ